MAGTLITNSIAPDIGTNLYLNATQGAGNVVIGNTTTALATFTNAGTLIVGNVIGSIANTNITGNIISSQITSVSNTQITGTITNNVNSFLVTANTLSLSNTIITSMTAQASTSGTSIDFTGIPSWVKRVTVIFNEVSTNGTSGTLIQIGTSSGVVSSGYVSDSVGTGSGGTGGDSYTTGFGIRNDSASYVLSGHMVITLLGSNIWISSHTGKVSTAVTTFGGGSVTLGGTLNQIRFITANNTDTFDAGSINILYE
jgi:hypothetical protein